MKATLIALAAAAPLLLAACGKASSESADAAAKPAEAAASDAKPAQAGAASIVKETDMIWGDPAAPVTLIEYASVTCPHCATTHFELLPAIKEKFVDTGKVKIIFREFPTAPVEHSLIGSLLARCAAEKNGQDAYFLVLDSLFRNQRTWISANAKAELLKIAAQAGMDEAALNACVGRQELVDLISKNVDEANAKYDVNSTPTFILNEKKVVYKSKEEFEKAIADAVEAARG